MKTFTQHTMVWLVAAGALALVVGPAPVQADDWGFSLNVPFFRIRAHDGYYYHDNDYHNHYWHYGHLYEPEHRYYYYPYRPRHRDHDHSTWIGPHGKVYKDHHR